MRLNLVVPNAIQVPKNLAVIGLICNAIFASF